MNKYRDRVKNRSPESIWGGSLLEWIRKKQKVALDKRVEKEKQEDIAKHGEEHDRKNPVGTKENLLSLKINMHFLLKKLLFKRVVIYKIVL